MKWKQILAALRAQGYAGKGDDLDAVKAFMSDNRLAFEGEDGPVDVEKVFKKTVTISVSADAGEDVQVVDGSAEGAEMEDGEEDSEDEDLAKTVARLQAENDRLKGVESRQSAKRRLGSVHKAAHTDSLRESGMKGFSIPNPARRAYENRIKRGKAAFSDADTAEVAGAWFRKAITGNVDYPERRNDEEILRKANISTTNSAGGALVPQDFDADLIDIRERYGVFRGVANSKPMQRDTQLRPRRTGHLTVYNPGEAASITESNPTYDDVELVARKMATLTTVSAELLNDAAINIADDITTDIVWSFEKQIDLMGFIGDGTSTYFGVTGFTEALKGLSGTIANIAGLSVGSGNLHSELTLPNFEAVQANLPDLEGAMGEPAWYVHKKFYYGVMLPLARGAVSGTPSPTATEIVEGVRTPMYLGSPVVFTNAMPSTSANSQVCALYGWPEYSAMLGEVTGSMQIATSDQRYFEQDKIAVRGTTRVAVNVHDVGNASATASAREAGPVVGLITAAS